MNGELKNCLQEVHTVYILEANTAQCNSYLCIEGCLNIENGETVKNQILLIMPRHTVSEK